MGIKSRDVLAEEAECHHEDHLCEHVQARCAWTNNEGGLLPRRRNVNKPFKSTIRTNTPSYSDGDDVGSKAGVGSQGDMPGVKGDRLCASANKRILNKLVLTHKRAPTLFAYCFINVRLDAMMNITDDKRIAHVVA